MSTDSLILGNGTQLQLIGDLEELGLPPEAYAEREAAGRFTGERLFFTNPKLYRAIVALISRGLPYREIADICQISVNTACGVAAREGIPVETLRERIGRLGLDVASLTIEAIRDLLSDPEARAKMGIKDLAIAHGIAVSNAQLLLGAATARVEVGAQSAPGHDDYLRMLADAQREATAKRERNVTPLPAEDAQPTGLPAGNPEQKGTTAAAPEPINTINTSTQSDQPSE